ncbi:cellulase-like Ig domain-containing protein [Mucilaginibacter frigoritolerans]|uniref:Cellulase-like Ig domain-containing protein n=1 Tax=Mucilaginibacter frigoritolerans TaxID=652788 RepID=A0A562TP10_9SPHI|nr:glycoside hydrolase family 9 protein [Mucilaginibacter frigoritolerans]TWI95265.1 cellulase-like Ig domain-containing protein [Mucilaginibacter frigoritolerans]
MRYLLLLAAFIFLSAFYLVRKPMEAEFKDSAAYRWLNKKIYDKRTLDDMESLDHWKSFTSSGVQVVDARKVMTTPDSSGTVADISLSKQFVHQGDHSLLMTTPTRLEGPAPKNGRGWGRSGIRRLFNGEDWTKYNRISIWIYPDLPGFYTIALDAQLYNDGKEKLPAIFGQEGQTSWVLKNHQWNHIVWEIGNVARDKITSFEVSYGLSGSYPGESDKIHFYFDQMELEKVDPDKIEGWDVWKGRIAYAHTGYQTGAQKSAIGSYITAKDFKLINQLNGKVVLDKPVKQVNSAIGNFQEMDFSEVRTPGTYVLKAGETVTQPFRIEADVYERTVWKALNFFYAERCGMAIPGIHGNEHNDWICIHGNRKIVTNGGWHDAGDLSQSFEGTAEITSALLSMAEKLKERDDNPKLYDRVTEEAQWGLDWILKNNFGDGYRNTGSLNSRRTNDIIGDDDDPVTYAQNNPMANFEAAGVEALAYSVFKESDPRLAAYALKTAEADWQFAMAGMPSVKPSADIWRGTFDSNNVEDELPAQAIISSVALWKATHALQYKNLATRLAPLITNAQQRKRPDWKVPFTGFYYTSTTHERILHYCHRGREQAPTMALTALCDAFPDDANWMKWYASVTLYAEYLKTMAKYSAPYQMMPASIYVDTEYRHVPESRQESFRTQVLQGISLGSGHYLRIFPVWMDYRGNFGTILPQAQALASAGRLRGDLASEELATKQLEWIIGRNPFAESTMYGEGHDYIPLYSPSSGDMVGGLPVGIQTREANDAPYWPVQAMWTYKEIWGHPVTNWVWLLKDVEGSAIVGGLADAAVTFKDKISGQTTTILPDRSSKHFKITLPEGQYEISSKGLKQSQTFLPGSSYQLEFRSKFMFSYKITKQSAQNGDIVIEVIAQGTGNHQFTIRTDNLSLSDYSKEIKFTPGVAANFEWRGHITVSDEPWVAVIIADKNLTERKEIRGAAW